MELFVKHFGELTADELYDILKLRVDVFVVEQKCPYPELDGRDREAYHVYFRDERGIAAYLRVMDRGAVYPDAAAIGRVIARDRRQGLGSLILREGISVARSKFGAESIRLEAQTYARSLYEKAGFVQISGEYLEDGIAHIGMLLEL